MQEILDQLMGHLRGAWRFRWYMHLIAWPLCIGGWGFVYYMPDQYEASARVYVDTQSMLRPLLQGLAVQTNLGEEVQLMTRTLLSRPNLEKVARMTDMDLEGKTPADMEKLLERLLHTIKLSGQSRDNLYSISYTHKDPELAKEVVQSLLTLFVENSLGDTRKDTNSAQRFLDEQIKEYESRLVAAEEALKEFKRKNIGQMPNEGEEYYQRLQAANARLSSAELELKEAINRRDELQRQIRGEEPTFGMVMQPRGQVVGSSNTALDTRIQNLQTQLDSLLLKFTAKHPDVISLQSTIETLKKQKEDEMAQVTKAMPESAPGLETNPVYQQLKISMGESEANVAALSVRVKQFRAEVDQLKSMVDTIPSIEAELKQLNRDYEVNKKNYQTLLERRETAKISEQAGQSSDTVKFRIVEPPHASTKPVAPNRPLLISAVLVAGILAGAAFAFFMSQIKPTFDNPKLMTRELGVPVFGSVSLIWTGRSQMKRRAEVMVFAFGGVMLIVIYGGYMAYQLFSGGAA